MTEPETAKRPAHRPGLSEDRRQLIRRELGELVPRSSAYRLKRRQLAALCDRTERSIDQIFASIKEEEGTPSAEPDEHEKAGGPDKRAG